MSQNFDSVTARSEVAQFYEDRTVFITGATGFMGKVLVEKLLRSTNLRKIYLLIRPKRGVEVQTRLQDELLSSRAFDRLRGSAPGQLLKVEAVAGDITHDRLGLSDQDQKKLIDNVSVVFHSAATVKFDEDLTKSVAMNVEAVLSMIQLSKQMTKLEAFVHVSTAYCNCDRTEICEEVYPAPGNPLGMVQLCKLMDADLLNSPEMTAKLIGNRPNTYTYTKALAESLLITEGAGLPVSIVRPSIVSASWQEPVPGWVDNLNGPTGMIAGASKGVLRTLYCGRGLRADLVPVDIPINLLCCVAWRTATRPSQNVDVYNCTSSSLNPLRWGEFEAWGYDSVVSYPSKQMFWYPGGSMKGSNISNRICQFVFHSTPAYLVDAVARVTNQKPFMVKLSQKMHRATEALEYFTTHEWDWRTDKMVALNKQLSEADRTVFNFDVTQVNWPDYIDKYVQGVREYVFKEDEESLPQSKKLLTKMYCLDRGIQILMFIMFWRVLFNKSETAAKLWNFMIGLFFRFFRLLPVESAEL